MIILPPAGSIQVSAEVIDAADLAIAEIKDCAITTPAQYAVAGEKLLKVKSAQKIVAAFFAPMEEHAKALRKSIYEARDKLDVPLKENEVAFKRKIAEYEIEEQRQRQEEEARIRKELIERADAEAAQKAAEAAISGEDSQSGFPDPLPMPPPSVVLQKEVPRVQGLSSRTDWYFEIVDASKLPGEFLMPDEKKIHQVVRAMKSESERQIPGIRVFEKKIIVGRAR